MTCLHPRVWHHLVFLGILLLLPSLIESSSITPSSVLSYTTLYHSTNPSGSSPPTGSRLDFISVIVICSIVAFCFIICLIVGCRRKKRRQRASRFQDLMPTADVSRSVTETDGPTQSGTNAVQNRSPNNGRRPTDSPPPTYSVIERQTSFTSHISQTSSMIEVPPEYDEAWDPNDTDGTDDTQHIQRAPSGRQHRSLRNGSGRGRGRRSHSDVVDVRRRPRRRISSRPSTVSEDETASDANTTARSIDVIIEVTPRSSTIMESTGQLAECGVSSESSRPLLGLTETADAAAATVERSSKSTRID